MTGVLDGKVAVVTGASRGIGAATATALSTAGASVVLAARDESALEEVGERIRGLGGTALVVPTDVREASAVERLVARTVEEHGRLDLTVNNAAGAGARPTPLAEVSVEDFDEAVAVSLRGVFLSMKYELPALLAGGGGAIVNMASTAGLEAVAGLPGYVASKHGVIGLTKTAALDYADQGIRINAVAPGPILTSGLARAGEDAQQGVARSLPMHRVGTVDEVASTIVWLCTESASFITGAAIPVDGGKMAGMSSFSQGTS